MKVDSTLLDNFSPAPRYQVDLRSWVAVLAVGSSTEKGERNHFLRAMTRDLSESGIGLIVAERDFQEVQFLGSGLSVRLMLMLDETPIEIEAEPVRYDQLGTGEGGDFLIGARITRMSDADRDAYTQFLKSEVIQRVVES